MRGVKLKAVHGVEVRDGKEQVSNATDPVRDHRLRVHPLIGKKKPYPPLMLTAIHAQEVSAPRRGDKFDWKLLVRDGVMIETFHKILKLSWWIFRTKMMNRLARDASRLVALMPVETRLLDTLIPDRMVKRQRNVTLYRYLTKINRFGGYIARAKAPPHGNMVMWRGVSRLTVFELGFPLAAQRVGK